MEAEVLEHIGRYRLSVRGVIERLFFSDGGSCDSVLKRLASQGRIQAVKKAIPGGLSYYQLSVNEARRLSAHEPRGAHERVVRRNLAVLWFCCMTEHKRMRLSPVESARLAPGLNSPHVAEENGADGAIYRVYLPAPETKTERFAESLREDAFSVVEHDVLSRWASRGTYRLAVVVESNERAERLKRAIGRRDLPRIGLHFEAVPAFERLHKQLSTDKEIE